MRISDWSSDVCSSDLVGAGRCEMVGLSLSRRARMALMVVFLLGLLLFFPLRLAAGLAGTERMGISARDVRGSIWGGRIDQLMPGRLPMGSVQIGRAHV